MNLAIFLRDGRALVALRGGVLVAGCVTFAPSVAQAYTISSFVTTGCHESITSAALRAVRLELATAAPLRANRNERALINDLEFVPDSDMADLGGATLLVGVRDNDLKGRDSGDVTQLALVHGDPRAQREHCLRSTHEKEPNGSEMAVRDCRAFIRERVGQALEGLDATGTPDLAKRTSLPLYLSLRHGVDASLPTYYVRIGQAIHALEDSFTHTYRTPDGLQITSVLDYVDEANGNLTEASDGPPHSSELDRCDDADELRTLRHTLATEAASAILRTTLDPSRTVDQKMAAVDVTLDKYLSYSPGCTPANAWCDAPEHEYGNGSGLGCNMSGKEPRASGFGWAGLLGLLGLLGRRRWRKGGTFLGVTALLSSTFLSSHAVAQTNDDAPSPDTSTETHAPPPPVVAPVKEPGPKDPSKTALGAYLGASGSVNHQALAATLGARLRLSRNWTFGVDAEWNPWIAVNGSTAIRAGAFNGYGTVIWRMPLAYEQFNLRSTLNLGMSRLLIDLYGAPKGTTGIYAGLSPLGLEWKMSRTFYLVVNPLNFALPVPQLKGVPFSYWQYRFTLGLEIYAG
jgi:MYXO-CTERM domain-containing protein